LFTANIRYLNKQCIFSFSSPPLQTTRNIAQLHGDVDVAPTCEAGIIEQAMRLPVVTATPVLERPVEHKGVSRTIGNQVSPLDQIGIALSTTTFVVNGVEANENSEISVFGGVMLAVVSVPRLRW
jgi:hypothetical protein